ncbi:GSCOCG00013391001-RA-CDS [Cotesia congregata]|uniref:Similar to ALKBH8: Alkylated DNA repair protein alkB homolog 8 (Bos taurus) n=1 Tax=Cotesia congregata TaxID=51543 RepID=A0A8J2ECG0_COTCN|nr:GSCOCG00013391001-RA-CDS [Cotesia congregata]CAG5075288.1 Similar to ALKBH8: Alkylated DNA repair protein alkB homolog 8 (Bos taurus) [Cotesia congregata]
MEKNTSKSRKCNLKQRKASERLARDLNIISCENPTEFIAICNAGLVTGLKHESLELVINKISTNNSNYKIVMPRGKSYCFIKFEDSSATKNFYDKLNGEFEENLKTTLYLIFCESIPDDNEPVGDQLPGGLRLIEEFISREQEDRLLQLVDWDEHELNSELKHRKVKHFGYEFCYKTNRVDPNSPIEPIPADLEFLYGLFEEHGCGRYKYDQITINRYLPGQGIPPHIDTHSPFEDTILSLSCGSACVMDFKHEDKKIQVYLPARSLLIMSGESRYTWTHGVCPRHHDVVEQKQGDKVTTTTLERGTRISFTFRKIRTGDCPCNYNDCCDSKKSKREIDQSKAPLLESSYVHQVYDEISSHFDETRHKQWPNVAKFIDSIDPGSILLDVGCGNGKYLTPKTGLLKIGCDRSNGLLNICRSKSYQVFQSDCLKLPFRSNSCDAAISIAVIHHLSTADRRRDAFLELIRILRPFGRCLIYVWAKEQRRNKQDSAYLKLNPGKIKEHKNVQLFEDLELPVHDNRTNFSHNDVMVPWKTKSGNEFLRYYHVFDETEFRSLCLRLQEVSVVDIYYDQGNWCCILEKKSSLVLS